MMLRLNKTQVWYGPERDKTVPDFALISFVLVNRSLSKTPNGGSKRSRRFALTPTSPLCWLATNSTLLKTTKMSPLRSVCLPSGWLTNKSSYVTFPYGCCSCKEAAKYADKNEVSHIETSAKSDTNIGELFQLVGRAFVPVGNACQCPLHVALSMGSIHPYTRTDIYLCTQVPIYECTYISSPHYEYSLWSLLQEEVRRVGGWPVFAHCPCTYVASWVIDMDTHAWQTHMHTGLHRISLTQLRIHNTTGTRGGSAMVPSFLHAQALLSEGKGSG